MSASPGADSDCAASVAGCSVEDTVASMATAAGTECAASSSDESRDVGPSTRTRDPLSPQPRDPFATLQAILAGLPMYALKEEQHCRGCCCASRRGGCLCCCHPQVIDSLPWVLPCHERIEVALLVAKSDYPQFREELGRLRVAHASHDLTVFVDDHEKRMFTSLRGTDWRTCRDLGNDCLILGGCWLCRTKWVREEYCHTRRHFLGYRSYGCGHSLGGTVMTELAHVLEDVPEFAFHRVDVFNTGGSPLAREYSDLQVTEYNSHRVKGDIVSKYFRAPGKTHEHPARDDICAHSLHHFLPEPAQLGDMLHTAEVFIGGCCTGMERRVHEGGHLMSRGVQSGAQLLARNAYTAGEVVATGVQSGTEVLVRTVSSASDLVVSGVQEGAAAIVQGACDTGEFMARGAHSSADLIADSLDMLLLGPRGPRDGADGARPDVVLDTEGGTAPATPDEAVDAQTSSFVAGEEGGSHGNPEADDAETSSFVAISGEAGAGHCTPEAVGEPSSFVISSPGRTEDSEGDAADAEVDVPASFLVTMDAGAGDEASSSEAEPSAGGSFVIPTGRR